MVVSLSFLLYRFRRQKKNTAFVEFLFITPFCLSVRLIGQNLPKSEKMNEHNKLPFWHTQATILLCSTDSKYNKTKQNPRPARE